MSTTLFDGFGRPLEYAGYSAQDLYETTQEDGLRLTRPNLNQDIATLLSRERHRALVSDARYIASTFPLVAGAIQQKSHYVCQAGFDPVFNGDDTKWGDLAREKIVQANKIINVRGPQYDWNTSWKIGCTSIDIDGGFFVVLGETDTGYPQIQFLEAHRVGSRNYEREITSGPYKGLSILNGIIYNARGLEVAYRVLGATPDADRDISALDMYHVATPRWFSDGRPFPTVAYSILDWYDVKETRGFQKTKAKANAAIVMTESTPDGKAPPSSMAEALRKQRQAATAVGDTAGARSTALTQPIQQIIAGGLIRYIKAGQGELKVHADNTPGDSTQKFDETVVRGAFYGMDWRIEMLDLSKLSGAPTRGFADQINTTIFDRWGRLTPFILRAELWKIRKLIQRGEIPDHAEWWKWAYVPPADFVVDQGRVNKADLDNVRAGAESMPAVIGRYGRTSRDLLREQAKYIKLKRQIEQEEGLQPGELGTLAQPGMQPVLAEPGAIVTAS